MHFKKFFSGSRLTARFFLIFLIYSFIMIALTVIIAAAVVFTKGPPGPPPHHGEHEFPPPHPMEQHDFHDPGFDRHMPPPDGEFGKKPPKGPPGLLTDLATTLSILIFFMIILSFFIATYLSKYFMLPVSQLATAAKKFSKHDFTTRISVNRKDEIGELASDFNEMADRLQKYEIMRKQWIADIAHELRTPISILQAEIEAVQDSVRPLDMKTIDHLHSEITYLAKIVNDLHLLTIAESRHLTVNIEKISIPEIVLESCDRFLEKMKAAKISLETKFESENLFIKGDSYLLRMVFNNLIENSIRYTDSPGKLVISATQNKGRVILTFEDTAPGVPGNFLDQIFDRLFRVDSSRSRKHGGSGLGLSTCRAHIELLKGNIRASHSRLGGLKIIIDLPKFISEEEL